MERWSSTDSTPSVLQILCLYRACIARCNVAAHVAARCNVTAISAVQSDLSSEVPYICGHMIFPRAAQQVGCTDVDRRILLFRRWIRG